MKSHQAGFVQWRAAHADFAGLCAPWQGRLLFKGLGCLPIFPFRVFFSLSHARTDGTCPFLLGVHWGQACLRPGSLCFCLRSLVLTWNGFLWQSDGGGHLHFPLLELRILPKAGVHSHHFDLLPEYTLMSYRRQCFRVKHSTRQALPCFGTTASRRTTLQGTHFTLLRTANDETGDFAAGPRVQWSQTHALCTRWGWLVQKRFSHPNSLKDVKYGFL